MSIFRNKRPLSKNQTALMLIFCQKNVHSLKNTMLSCHFFFIYMIYPCCHARIWSANCQFCQNYIKLWTKKVNRMPFFLISHKKSVLSFPFFVKKRPFSENKLLLCQYWGKKHQFFQKQGDLILFVFNFSRKTRCCHVHIWSKKRQFCQNYTILLAKKVNRMPFLSDFHK